MTYVHCVGTDYCGLEIRKWLRLSAVIGLSISIAYIMLGAEIITQVTSGIGMSLAATSKSKPTKENIMYVYDTYMVYKGNEYVLLGLSITLVSTNFFQVIGDVLLFYTSLIVVKEVKIKLLWILFINDIILWIISLLCFIVIFSGSGILLLGIFLIGTCIRTAVLFILRQFIAQLKKPMDSRDFT